MLYNVKEKGGRPDRKPRKPYPLPYGLRNLKRNRTLKICPETSRKLYVHDFGLLSPSVLYAVYRTSSKKTFKSESPVSHCMVSGGVVLLII
jgi:hypothetical protein